MTQNQIYIENRIIEEAKYIITTRSTIRTAAKKFGVSKSTIHKDLVEKLPNIHSFLALEVRNVLENNKDERHIRGGIATKNKYREMN